MAKELNDNELEGVAGGYILPKLKVKEGARFSGTGLNPSNYYVSYELRDDKDDSLIGEYKNKDEAIKVAQEKRLSIVELSQNKLLLMQAGEKIRKSLNDNKK